MASVTTASRYRLFDEVAAGGMASVHLGLQSGASGFSRVVAVKRLLPELAREVDFVHMFVDEARLAARIRHPNVVHILDVVSDNGQLLLVMEYVLGESLAGLLVAARRAERRIPLDIVSAIMSGVLHGLHAAHEARDEKQAPLRIVHRDVSPQNVLVGEDGIARVIDFGVAKAVGRLTTTRDGRVKGKAGYMAPEQLRGQPVDRRVDVYAAGVVLWELATRQRLFVGDSPAATMMLVLERDVIAPSATGAKTTPEFDAIVLRATTKAPDQRFATAEEMALALEAAVRPAPANVVASWAREIAGDVFAKRRAMVVRVESGEAIEVGASRSTEGLAERDETRAATVATAPLERPRTRWPLALLSLPVFGLAGWYALHRTPPMAPGESIASAAANPPSTPSASVRTSPPPMDSQTTITANDASATSAATTSAAASATVRRPVATVRPSTAPATTRIDCDPPYVLDAKGIRVPKKECL